MKNLLKLSTKIQTRKKTTIYNIVFITLIILILLLLYSYYLSSSNYLKNDIKKAFYYRTLEVWKNDNNLSLDEIKDELSHVEHVVNVSNSYSYRTYINSKEFKTNKLDGDVEIYSANNKTLPKIISGTDFPNDNGNYIICPKTFFPNNNITAIKKINKNQSIDIKEYLNKNIEFSYKSAFGNNDYTITFKLIGLYENSANNYDENICYVQENSLQEIAENIYSDDIDVVTGESNMIYQTNFIIQIDSIQNMDFVIEQLIQDGYSYDPMAMIDNSYFDNIRKNILSIIFIVMLISFAILFILFIKEFKDDYKTYVLLNYLGYNKKQIFNIYFFSNLISLFISIIISFIISLILFSIINLILSNYPLILNKWQICVDYSPIILISVLSIVILIITSIINFHIFKRKNYD